jgi:hypothetical protein
LRPLAREWPAEAVPPRSARNVVMLCELVLKSFDYYKKTLITDMGVKRVGSKMKLLGISMVL